MFDVFLRFAEQRKLSANMREVSEAPDSPLHGLCNGPTFSNIKQGRVFVRQPISQTG
jgi:hypothetical protein